MLTNAMGGPIPPTENDKGPICTSCQLAAMLELGVITGAVDAGHSDCEGTTEAPCGCRCAYANRAACKECGRKEPSDKLDATGQCIDRRDCANTILQAAAKRRAERTQRAAEAPSKRPSGGGGGAKRPCTCGCGETTGGGLYRPGHDARHVSQLTASVKAGELDYDAASRKLAHSAKLQGKLDKALGR